MRRYFKNTRAPTTGRLQSEWATDVVFRPGELRRLEPLLLRHGLLSFSSPDVMRFLGKKIPLSGQIPGRFAGELVSDLKRRAEGDRIKHRIDQNSVKAYGKAHTPVGDVWRVETTINQAKHFRVYRPKEGGPHDQLAWRRLRAGVADLHRRAEVAQKANERYLDALSTVDDSQRLEDLMRPLEQPKEWNGRRVRALHPFQTQDNQLLAAVNYGEFVIHGFRNRDLQKRLYSQPAQDSAEARRRSAALCRDTKNSSLSGEQSRSSRYPHGACGSTNQPGPAQPQSCCMKIFAEDKQFAI
jgi:hypothetical protein